MNIVCFGLSHRTAAVEVRERFAFADKELPAATRRLRALEGVREALILSTCNRVEHYAVLDDGPEPVRRASDLFRLYCETGGLTAHADGEQFYHHDAPDSVTHLFRVASGLDSMVLGETEILGQVKQAYLVAAGAGTVSRVLNKLFQRAFQAAKQVRSDTEVGRGTVSVASAAVDLAERLFGDLERCRALVLGAGETGERTARALLSRGVRPEGLSVANRSPERAAALAAALGGRAVPEFDGWEREAGGVDILITSTAAQGAVVTAAQLGRIMRARSDRPLFVIDIAVPRDVEPAANDIEGVYLYDIDSLQEIARQAMASRTREMEACERIIGRHVEEFESWVRRAGKTRNAERGTRNRGREIPRCYLRRFKDRCLLSPKVIECQRFDYAMPLPLTDSRWNELRGSYNGTEDVTKWLAEAYERGSLSDERLGDLINEVQHQGDTSTAMYAVAGHFVELARRASPKGALTLLTHAGIIHANSDAPRAVPCPAFLSADFAASALEGAKMLSLLLPIATNFAAYKWAVAGLAGFIGHRSFARLLDGLDLYEGQFYHALLDEPFPKET